MSKLLYVVGSPRKQNSYSSQIAEGFLESFKQKNPDVEVDVLDLWHEQLPEFDGDKASAKMTIISGQTLNGREKTAWDEVLEVIERFNSADHYLFTVPMWNGSIPYRLKLYIDILTQPGLLFGLDASTGYSGLLHGKQATVIYTSGVYSKGVDSRFGVDFQTTYFDWWLRLVGIQKITPIILHGNMMTTDPAQAVNLVTNEAQTLAQA